MRSEQPLSVATELASEQDQEQVVVDTGKLNAVFDVPSHIQLVNRNKSNRVNSRLTQLRS